MALKKTLLCKRATSTLILLFNISLFLSYVFYGIRNDALLLKLYNYNVTSSKSYHYNGTNAQNTFIQSILQNKADDKLCIIHLVQGDKLSIGKYPMFNHFRDDSYKNDLIYYNWKEKKDSSFNYYDKILNVYNIYSLQNLTWSEGRNYLLKMAFKFEKHSDKYIKYDYFAFFDDDLQFISTATKKRMNDSEWITMYEYQFKNEISMYQPAIMSVFMEASYSRFRGDFNPNHCESKSCSVTHYDPCAVWIHRELIQNKFVFPYITDFKNISWWAAGRIVWIMTYSMYFNHIFMYYDFYVQNIEHRSYSKDAKAAKPLIYTFIKSKWKQIYGNDWIYYTYVQKFHNVLQYTLSGYPKKKGEIIYNDYNAFNNLKPIIPF